MNKHGVLFALTLAGMSAAGATQASTIAFSGEVHTGNSEFSIHNMSDAGISITEVTLTMGVESVLSVNPSMSISDAIEVGHFGDASIVGDHAADYTTASAFNVGYTGTLAADVIDGAISATFNFDDFDSGEAWGINVDFDSAFGVEDTPGGSMLDGMQIDVTFFDGTTYDTLSFIYSVGGGDGKKSFPTDPVPFNDASELAPVPVPASLWLLGSGLMGLVGVARRRTR